MGLRDLSCYKKRLFVPESIDLTDPKAVVGLYELLEKRVINSAFELEQWLFDRSEIDAALSQVGSILYIEMTCQTDDQSKSQAYTQFIETVPPAIKPVNDRLNQLYVKLRQQFPAVNDRYFVHDRSIKIDIDLFNEKNIPLQTEVELLSQEYQTICGSLTVEYEGKEQTMAQMSKYLLGTDRVKREEVWRLTSQKRLAVKDKLDEIFNKMYVLRNQISANSGFSSFTEYQFKNYHRFDYTPKDCEQYALQIEKHVVPLYRKILEQRKKEMGLSVLRPWDGAVDSLGRQPLKPFDQVEQLIDGVKRIFKQLDPDLSNQFNEMINLGLLDLANRKGKAPGGYQNTLSEARKPFIFMNAIGVDDDVRTLLHESGHAFHAIAAADDPLGDYRHAPMEFCEVASMAMELLGGEHIDAFYNKDDVKRSNREHFEGIIHTLCWVATIDTFQQWIYAHPKHSVQERTAAWVSIYDRFSTGIVDWSGLEDVKEYLWHRQLHIFEVPFYYIEYGIAQLGALRVWLNAKKDLKGALNQYKHGLSLGGSRPLPELYQGAGIKFDFSENTIKPLSEAVFSEWQKLI